MLRSSEHGSGRLPLGKRHDALNDFDGREVDTTSVGGPAAFGGKEAEADLRNAIRVVSV